MDGFCTRKSETSPDGFASMRELISCRIASFRDRAVGIVIANGYRRCRKRWVQTAKSSKKRRVPERTKLGCQLDSAIEYETIAGIVFLSPSAIAGSRVSRPKNGLLRPSIDHDNTRAEPLTTIARPNWLHFLAFWNCTHSRLRGLSFICHPIGLFEFRIAKGRQDVRAGEAIWAITWLR